MNAPFHRSLDPVARAAVVGFVTVVADQVTKSAASAVAGGLHNRAIVPVRNHEFSLGIASASLPVMLLLMVAGIIGLGSHLMRASARGRVPAWVTGLILGGAISNLLDRLVGGSVRDFLATPWIVLNVADLAVVVGLASWAVAGHHRPASRR